MANTEVFSYFEFILSGLWTTFQITFYGCLTAFVLAFSVGFLRLSSNRFIQVFAISYIEFFRGTSIFVQLFWAYFVLPLLGVSMTPFQIGVAVLGLNVSSYAAETVRGGILSVPIGQTEVAIALNMSVFHRMHRIILPQAIPVMLPTFGNNAIELLKATAVVSLVAIDDMTFQAQMIRSQTGNTLVPFLFIFFAYYGISLLISSIFRLLEKYYRIDK